MFEKLKSAFKKISTKTITDKNIDSILDEFKIELVRNDVAYKTAEEICNILKKEELIGKEVGRLTRIKTLTIETMKNILIKVLSQAKTIDLLEFVKEKNAQGGPAILLMLGVNGTGKTTTIAKLTNFFQKNNLTVVLAAGDTFRAGSIEQLSKHAENLKVKCIKHEYGSDSASVAYDAINHAESKNINVVLIDTAGRMETNKNLMNEMKKIIRVSEPHLKIFVASLLVGNDAHMQADIFNKEVGIDASILNMADADIKGGATLSVAHITKKPILFLGNGQSYDDLMPFEPEKFAEMIFQN
ncbi:MAG: signal recognition particle-docking protein FtsY [Candidatus Lokiarchaeota archaeon]|nr:signal recognition particle-docking protein FtsY [Candidatus Lokiarchaeota archaeon]